MNSNATLSRGKKLSTMPSSNGFADEMSLTTPPHDFLNEQCLIGAVMVNPDCLDAVRQIIPDHSVIYDEQMRAAFHAICDLADYLIQVNLNSYDEQLVKARMVKMGYTVDFSTKDALQAVKELADPNNAEAYAKHALSDFQRRQLMDMSRRTFTSATDLTCDVSELLASLTQEAERIGEGG
jgi:replicative DNA helicase